MMSNCFKIGQVVALCNRGIRGSRHIRNVKVTRVMKTFIEIEGDDRRFSTKTGMQIRTVNGKTIRASGFGEFIDPNVPLSESLTNLNGD